MRAAVVLTLALATAINTVALTLTRADESQTVPVASMEFKMAYISVSRLVQNNFPRRSPTDRLVDRTTPTPKVGFLSTPQPKDWSDGQRFALLLIYSYASECAKDCAAHLREKGITASQYDFVFLRNNALAVRPLAERYHKLTPTGLRIADDVAKLVARNLNLHHIRYKTKDSRFNGASCTCGWGCTFDERYGVTGSQIERAIGRHLADPQGDESDG